MKNRRPDNASHFKNQLPRRGKEQAAKWFRTLRNNICAEFERIETELSSSNKPAGSFKRTSWDRPEGGGGEMSVMKGRVFEKVGVNISTVHGEFSEQFQSEIPGASDCPYFWASGISLVAHMCSPLVPAVHMNTRMITLQNTPTTSDEHRDNSICWFGGGTDLTPIYPNQQDTRDFHAALKATCDKHNPGYYPEYKAWCDEYFYLKHRDEPRGVGGIFYDYLSEGPKEEGWNKNVDFHAGYWQNVFAYLLNACAPSHACTLDGRTASAPTGKTRTLC